MCISSCPSSEILGREDVWNVLLCIPALFSMVQILVLPLLPDAPRYLFIEKGDEKACKKGWLGFPLLRRCLTANIGWSRENGLTSQLWGRANTGRISKKYVSYTWHGCDEYKQGKPVFFPPQLKYASYSSKASCLNLDHSCAPTGQVRNCTCLYLFLIIVGAVGTCPVNPSNYIKTAPVFHFACPMFPSPPVSLGWRRVQRRDGWNASRADGPRKGPTEERPAALEGQGRPMAAGVHLRDRLLQHAVWHLCGNDAGAFLNIHL